MSLWGRFNSCTGQVNITATLPDTITTWVASAFAISKTTGFAVAQTPAKVGI